MKDRVIEILSEILKVNVDENSLSGSVPEWDSLAHMRIIVALEEKFAIEIEDEELPKLSSLIAIVNYLDSKINA